MILQHSQQCMWMTFLQTIVHDFLTSTFTCRCTGQTMSWLWKIRSGIAMEVWIQSRSRLWAVNKLIMITWIDYMQDELRCMGGEGGRHIGPMPCRQEALIIQAGQKPDWRRYCRHPTGSLGSPCHQPHPNAHLYSHEEISKAHCDGARNWNLTSRMHTPIFCWK